MSAVATTQTDSSKSVAMNDTGTILISRNPIVSAGDITGATAAESGDQWVVNITVTDDAAERVHEFTQHHVGTNLAVAVDGKVHGGTPRIASAITSNSYEIDGFNRADAEQLAAGMSNGCRR